jgi:putative ABC transport system permease protein
MYWISIAIKNLLHRPLSGFLSALLFALSIGLVVFLYNVNSQLKTKFEKNLAGIDLVLGAKGSPLQLILCNMYHIDAPTGNISLKDARPFLRDGHPLISASVPLSLGDSHKGYRIVGTDERFLERYEAKVGEGSMWSKPMDVVVGSTVADRLGMKLGDTFKSAHGLTDNEDMLHEDSPGFKVVGILEPNGSVVDLLILTPTQSVWVVHENHDHGDEGNDHDHEEGSVEDGHEGNEHDHNGHDHADHGVEKAALPPLLEEADDREITSILLEFKGRNYQSLNMARNINENTNLMAASPAIEINRLFSMMGVGLDALEYLVYLIGFVAFISIFISLYQSMRARKYEMALLKVQGASGAQLFWSVCLEGILLAISGGVIGVLGGRLAIQLLSGALAETYKYDFDAWTWSLMDLYVLAGAVLLAIVAALIPALNASRMNVHEVLSKG